MVDLPLRATWFATGNNVVVKGDTARRCCHVRIESPVENPERRTGFEIPRLIEYAREHRIELLTAALTLLRWFAAHAPAVRELPPWGSYEGWSARVRNTLVAAGCPDPGSTRRQLAEAADTDAEALRALLAAWPSVDWHLEGITAAEVARRIAYDERRCGPMRDVLLEVCGVTHPRDLTARRIGFALRRFRRRVVGTRRPDYRTGHSDEKRWYVADCAPCSDADDT